MAWNATHLDCCHGTLRSCKTHERTRLPTAAATTHYKDLLDLAVFGEYLRISVHSACTHRGSERDALRTCMGRPCVCLQHTAWRVFSSVPGGAPPTKSLFSGLGLVSDVGSGCSAMPTAAACS